MGVNLHSISSSRGVTPFGTLIDSLYSCSSACLFSCSDAALESLEVTKNQFLPDLLPLWLGYLQESGVDLEKYGRKEVELHEEGLLSWTLHQTGISHIPKIQRIVYGPLPNDWKLQVDVAEKLTVGGPQRVPGGWIEDDDLEQRQDPRGQTVNEPTTSN